MARGDIMETLEALAMERDDLRRQLAERDAELKDANARNADLTRAIADSAARTFEPHPAASLIERAERAWIKTAHGVELAWSGATNETPRFSTRNGMVFHPTLHAALTALAGEAADD